MSTIGLALGTVVLVVAGSLSALSLHLLSDIVITMTEDSQGPAEVSFYSVCIAASPRARYVVDAAIAAKCFGVATSYLQVIGQLGASLVEEHPVWLTTGCLQVVGQFGAFLQGAVAAATGLAAREATRGLIIFSVVACVITPSVFHKRITKTVRQNMLAIGAWLYVAVLVVVHALRVVLIDPAASATVAPTVHFRPPPGMDFQVVATALPIYIFSFTCHQNLFSVATELKQRTLGRLDLMLAGSVGTGLALYAAVGLGGYASFGDGIKQDILLNLPSSGFVLAGRVLVVVAVVFTYPLQLHPCRRSVMLLAQAAKGRYFERREERIWRRALTICILLGTFAVSVLVDDLGLTLAFVGAVGSNTVVLIMPAFMYLCLHHKDRGCLWRLALGQFVVGCVILPTCLTGIIWKLLGSAPGHGGPAAGGVRH